MAEGKKCGSEPETDGKVEGKDGKEVDLLYCA